MLVGQGEALGSVQIRGGEVPVVAGRGLTALVRVSQVDLIERILTGRASAAYPPPTGAVVGFLRLRGPAATLGRIPVLAADLAPPREPSGRWWGRAVGAVARAVTAVVRGLFG
jgi:hypothetical protein